MGRILLVEDDVELLRALGVLLRLRGHQIEVAGNGREGLEILKSTNLPYDLIVSDVRMPEMDGVTMARELDRQQVAVGTPILFISAWITERDLPSLRFHPVQFVQKSQRFDQIMKAIVHLVQKKSA